MRPLALTGLYLALLALIAGCSYSQKCYEAVSVNPGRGFGVVFNTCDGTFGLTPFALPPDEAPKPAPDAKQEV